MDAQDQRAAEEAARQEAFLQQFKHAREQLARPTTATPTSAVLATPATIAAQHSKQASQHLSRYAPVPGAYLDAQRLEVDKSCQKCERELHVGNLTPGQINRDQLYKFFNESVQAVFPNQGLAVLGANMHSGGKYCFIEFKTMEMCTAALDLNGFVLLGVALTVSRPAAYKKLKGLA